jgi:hypothetical protein
VKQQAAVKVQSITKQTPPTKTSFNCGYEIQRAYLGFDLNEAPPPPPFGAFQKTSARGILVSLSVSASRGRSKVQAPKRGARGLATMGFLGCYY